MFNWEEDKQYGTMWTVAQWLQTSVLSTLVQCILSMCSINVTVQEDKPMVRTVTLKLHTSTKSVAKCSIETSTNLCSIKESVPIDRAVAQCYLCIYIWCDYIERRQISHFCDALKNGKSWRNQRIQRNQRNQLSVFSEIFHTQNHTLHTLRLFSPWGCPGTYPIAQYTAYPSGDCHTA